MMPQPLITINIVVHNGEKYIRQCLESVFKQAYPHDKIELNILDNSSTDSTAKIVKEWSNAKCQPRRFGQSPDTKSSGMSNVPRLSFFRGKSNLGMWPGQEWLFDNHTHGKYVIGLSVDVILHPDFVKNAIAVMEKDDKIGALQAKIYRAQHPMLKHPQHRVLDTCGFEIYRSRRIVNIGHGEFDRGQHDKQIEIFGVEGAVPVFRRETLDSIRIGDKVIDPDFFWYGDDMDLAWRINIFGWKQVYAPDVIAWHDRQTTKVLTGNQGWQGWLQFIEVRKTVPKFKRRLDYRNWLFAVIKNDYLSNLIHDLGHILKRQFMLWGYFLLFEPWMFLEIPQIVKKLPKMVQRRREVMKKARVKAREIRRWFK